MTKHGPTPIEPDNSGPRRAVGTRVHPYAPMILSAILPGLGQLCFGESRKAILIFVAFASALGIIYLNSIPVTGWGDLVRLKPTAIGEPSVNSTENVQEQPPYEIHIWTFDDGKQLMYRPSWKLKISGVVQGIICWIYAIGDGWWRRDRKTKQMGHAPLT